MAQWGTLVKPKVEGAQARVAVDVSIVNDGKLRESFTLRHQVVGPDGKPAGQTRQARVAIDGSAEAGFKATFSVPRPRLWSLEQPNLHTLTTTVLQGGRVIDRYDTRFGIRTVVFDPDKGFFLNGKALRLQGTNNHQDHARFWFRQ